MMRAGISIRTGGRAAAALGLVLALAASLPAPADTLAISEYAKITSTLPWAVAFKK